MGGKPEGAVRRRTLPEWLRGENFSDRKFMEWARAELGGEEPHNLEVVTKKAIKMGQTNEVWIRPRKPGFFGPDGRFIEAFEYAPGFGEDLKEADRQWDQEEQDREWADGENRKFNKSTVVPGPGSAGFLWEHGRRISEYVGSSGRPASTILQLLDRRKTAEGYTRHTHQTSYDLYRWMPELVPDSPVLGWSWERIDAVLRFSNDNRVRKRVLGLLTRPEMAGLSDLQVTRLLARKQRSMAKVHLPAAGGILEEIRSCLKSGKEIGTETVKSARLSLEMP